MKRKLCWLIGKMRKLLVFIFAVVLFLVLKLTPVGCMIFGPKKERYADQVIHGVAGGIAGPVLDPSLFEPQYPLKIKAPYFPAWPSPPLA